MSPRDPNKFYYFHYRGLALFADGRYSEAGDWTERAIQDRPVYTSAHRSYVAFAALADQKERARLALAALKRTQPDVSLAWVEANQPQNDVLRARFIEGLRLAGLT